MFTMIRANSKFIAGAVVGVGVAAAGYYLYKKNQEKIDNFLKSQGINLPSSTCKDYKSMSLEELVLNKEKIEDILAEKKMIESK